MISKLKEDNEKLLKDNECLQSMKSFELENKKMLIEKDNLTNEIIELNEKYQNLLEIESPLKGVNEMKQILKKPMKN